MYKRADICTETNAGADRFARFTVRELVISRHTVTVGNSVKRNIGISKQNRRIGRINISVLSKLIALCSQKRGVRRVLCKERLAVGCVEHIVISFFPVS